MTRRRADGTVAIQWYAWQGAGAPLIAAFTGPTMDAALAAERDGAAALFEAYGAARRSYRPADDLKGLLWRFQESADFEAGLAASTQAEWARVLKALRADAVIAPLSLKALAARGARALILDWRDTMAATPRKADYYMQVLCRALNWAVERELLTRNPIEGWTGIYRNDRADVVFDEAELAALLAHLTPDAALAVRFIRLTGFRRGDALRVTWSAVKEEAGMIVWKTSKGRRRGGKPTTQVVEITAELAALMAEIPRRGVTILTTAAGRPWHKDGLGASFRRARIAAAIAPADDGTNKRLHDLRGATATETVAELFDDPRLQSRLGWSKGEGKIARAYVSPENVVALSRAKRNAE